MDIEKSLLDKFWQGRCNKEEARKVLKWFNSFEADTYFSNNIDFIWYQYQQGKVPKHLKEIAFANIQNKIAYNFDDEIEYKNLPKAKHSSKSVYMRIAAVIIFLVVAIGSSKYFIIKESQLKEQTGKIQWIEKSTQPGQKLTIYLNDGSKIILNAASSIKYSKTYFDSSRRVYLQGEAFFDVVSDSLKPFTVVTEDLSTTALGTSFNIRAYPKESDIRIALVTGKVLVKSNKHLEVNHALDVGEGVVFNKSTIISNKYLYNPASALSWKEGIIYFEDASIQQIFDELSLWYAVKFEVTKSFQYDRLYTGKFDNLSLEEVLKGLSYIKGFSYQINNGKVKIKPK